MFLRHYGRATGGFYQQLQDGADEPQTLFSPPFALRGFGVGREFLERSGASRHDNRVIRRSPWGGGIVRIADESSMLILC